MSPNSLYIIVSTVFIVVIGYDVYNWAKDRTILPPEIKLKRFHSKVNKTLLILGLTLLFVSVLFHVNILRYSPPIPFSEINTITLKDFKGYRKPFQTLYGEQDFAFITTSFEYESGESTVKLEAVFHPARSYVFNDNLADQMLLEHELYHFRITEIFARRCREELSKLKEHPTEDMIEDVLAFHERSENRMQQRYDYESYHGYLMKEQKRWSKEVDSLLNLLDVYKNPIVVYE